MDSVQLLIGPSDAGRTSHQIRELGLPLTDAPDQVDPSRALILVADDDELMREVAREALEEEGFRVQLAADGRELMRAFRRSQSDIVMLDVQMPEMDGFSTCAAIRSTPRGANTPILMMTGLEDVQSINRAYEVGATDFVTKPVNWVIVRQRLRYMLRANRAEDRIRHLALHDCLTDLPNRAQFEETLNRAIFHSDTHETHLAVLFLDLDHFKRINDTFGHATGDYLIQQVAERLARVSRRGSAPLKRTDGSSLNLLVSRFGGDEFTILVKGFQKRNQVATLSDQILAELATPVELAGHEVSIGASVGISVFPGDGMDGDALLKNADTAMYQAKDSGRQRYEFYSQSMNAGSLNRLKMENDLRRALDRQELSLVYQPKLDTSVQQIAGVEALARWTRPDGQQVSPAEFIPLAEETGLILPIGEWVLRTACRQSVAWQESGLPRIPVAINLSTLQFRQKNLASLVRKILDETGLDPSLLELEITETMVMRSELEAAEKMAQLKALGLRLSMDDFGTGYSSLSHLRRFPLDAVKIDRSFVRNIDTDPGDRAIIDAIIAMARSLELEAIAEGVETQAQMDLLQEMGCRVVQGYLICRPQSPETLAESPLFAVCREIRWVS